MGFSFLPGGHSTPSASCSALHHEEEAGQVIFPRLSEAGKEAWPNASFAQAEDGEENTVQQPCLGTGQLLGQCGIDEKGLEKSCFPGMPAGFQRELPKEGGHAPQNL